MLVSTLAAFAAATLFGVTTNLQRMAAAMVPADAGGIGHLVGRLIRNPRWLLSGVLGGVALALHALALLDGSVMVVQSVMALGLLFALALEARREHRTPRPGEVAGAALVVAGVGLVVGFSSQDGQVPVTGNWSLLVCTGVVAATLIGLARTRSGVGRRWQARALAAAGGACFAVDAVFLKGLAGVGDIALQALLPGSSAPGDGSGQDLTVETLVIAVVALTGFLGSSAVGGIAVHRAYQVAPLRVVQPALASAEPLTAFGIGVLVLHEPVRGGVAGFTVLACGFAAITAGILLGLGERSPRRAGADLEMSRWRIMQRPERAGEVLRVDGSAREGRSAYRSRGGCDGPTGGPHGRVRSGHRGVLLR
ncbi:MAG TPA: DMT family transporter [Kineosporiaceae bacterium]|nr:DMT family transporter [Kineosporiaceae bacterium]